ncbi:MAG: hypothetical protein EOP51_32580, partial [Sphingobacteriales bacterium]
MIEMLWYIYISLICLILLVSAFRWKLLSPSLRMLSLLVCWVLVIEVLRKSAGKETASVLTHLNFSAELLLQFGYYYIVLQKRFRPFLYIGLTFYFTALFVLWNVDRNFFTERDLIDSVFMQVCITLWSTIFFYELLNKPMQYSLESDGNFWVN